MNNPGLVETLVSRSDAVVHFAAESHVARSIFDDRVFFETDVLGTQTVASAVANHSRVERFIHVSTSEVYGTAEVSPMTEDHPLNPMTPYAAAKAGADRLVYAYQQTYELPAVIVRPFNQYGPFQHLEKVIPRFITSALQGEVLTVHGDGSSRRDWTFVSDTCEALDAVLRAPADQVCGQTFNVGTGYDVDVLTIARTIVDQVGADPALIEYMDDRPGQVQHHQADATKVHEVLGWAPKVTFDEGLRRTVEWYRANPEWWRPIAWMKHVTIKDRDGNVHQY